MTFNSVADSIFILDSGRVTDCSLKTLLEAQDHVVEIITGGIIPASIKRDDIVLLDIDIDAPQSIITLNRLLRRHMRPKLLIATVQQQIFERSDVLKGGASLILFKPYSAFDLLAAVASLKNTSH